MEYDGEKQSYLNPDGQIAKSISVLPEYSVRFDGKKAFVTAPKGNVTLIFAAYDEGGSLTGTQTETLDFEKWETKTATPENLDTAGRTVKAMLWRSIDAAEALCAAAENNFSE